VAQDFVEHRIQLDHGRPEVQARHVFVVEEPPLDFREAQEHGHRGLLVVLQ
jgi:hypothetical protein